MSGDRLAQIEERVRSNLSERRSHDICDRGECFYPEVIQTSEDVLALVKVAEAARAIIPAYEDEEIEHGFPFNFALRDAHRALVRSVARLDSEATEEDA